MKNQETLLSLLRIAHVIQIGKSRIGSMAACYDKFQQPQNMARVTLPIACAINGEIAGRVEAASGVIGGGVAAAGAGDRRGVGSGTPATSSTGGTGA